MLGLLGAPLPTVFGLLTFILNFIPSIGSWIATFLPVPVILFDPNQTVTTAILAIALPGAACTLSCACQTCCYACFSSPHTLLVLQASHKLSLVTLSSPTSLAACARLIPLW